MFLLLIDLLFATMCINGTNCVLTDSCNWANFSAFRTDWNALCCMCIYATVITEFIVMLTDTYSWANFSSCAILKLIAVTY